MKVSPEFDDEAAKRLEELNKKNSSKAKEELSPEEIAAKLEEELKFVKKWGGAALIG